MHTPRLIYIERKVRGSPLADRILRSLPDCSVYEIRDHRRLEDESVPLAGYDSGIKESVLVLAHNPGPFIRPFPGRPSGEGNPAEFYVAHANGCPFDCEYCFLQGYFDHGAPVLFVNQEDLLEQLIRHLTGQARKGPAVYHAGELSDALALEGWSGFAAAAIPLFRGMASARMELRTKCAAVEAYLPDRPPENVVVSWTLTPEDAWRRYEHRTPSPLMRLRSARACQVKGYRVGIRLDPAFSDARSREGYKTLMSRIFEHLRPEGIESFVIGGFRYPAVLAERIRERFPSSSLLLEEFVLCGDGKHRYFRPLRVCMYREILREIRGHDRKIPVHLCMETDQVNRDVFEV